MDAPRRFPFSSPISSPITPRLCAGRRFSPCSRLCLPAILAVLMSVPVAMATDHVDNPNQPDLTPAERAEPEEPETPWQDEQLPLPPFPRAQDLLPVRADAADPGYNYYIDVNSVSLGADEVLRYTVIIQSPRGASNIIYEGIRCATNEIKTLAYGTRGGDFEPIPNPQWTYVYTQGALGYRTTLMERYVCDENGWAVNSDTVLERLVLHDPRRPRVGPRPVDAGD